MKGTKKYRAIRGRTSNQIYSPFVTRITSKELYNSRRISLPIHTKALVKKWNIDWLKDPRVIALGFEGLLEFRTITAIDKKGHEWEACWISTWQNGKYIYDSETLQNLKWTEVPRKQIR